MKPVELIERASRAEGQLIREPLAGSGSALTTCKNIQRRAIIVEIDPRCVEVLIKRWQGYSGRDGYREADLRWFGEVLSETADELIPEVPR
jgi:DNA modification methylase